MSGPGEQVQETGLQTTEKLELKKINAGAEKVAELKLLASKYANLIVTEDTLDEADKARLELYRVRIDIQRDEKHNNKVLNTAKKINADNAEKLIKLIEPTEIEIANKINGVKTAIETRKREEAKKEQNRIREIKNGIALIEKRISDIRACESVQELDKIALEISVKENSFSEFNEEGNSVVKMALTAIQSRKLSLKEAEELAAKQTQKNEAVDNALNDLAVSNESARADAETQETEVHHPHEIAEFPDTPQTVIGDRPAFGHRNPVFEKPEGKEFLHMGYKFIIPSNLPAETENRIVECLKEIIDEMPI